ncbi:MAG: hypothetical protein JW726_01535 [Anaerolineales bacterium]|nr:hypothetical protein [Anaerolineales bacterium]
MNPFLEQVRKKGNPLMDGERVTFVWEGESAPTLMGDFTDWGRGEAASLHQVAPGTWVYELECPIDAYLEYAFQDGERRFNDPYNPCRTWNGINAYNHYFSMPAVKHTPLVRRTKGIPQGRVSTHQIREAYFAFGHQRMVHLYQPAVQEAVPLVVVWDGRDYLRRARLAVMVDNLIAQGRIRPVTLAMVENGRAARAVEYACSDATLFTLTDWVLPLARQHLNLIDLAEAPGAFGVLGASMGGLMALYTGLRLPQIFGKVLSQSGAFSFDEFDTVVFDLARRTDPKGTKIWMDVGKYDFLYIKEANRRMNEVLAEQGYDYTFRWYNCGHNYTAWRDEIWRGLEFLFGNQDTSA